MKKLLIIPFLLWATTAYCNPSNSLSLTNVVSGTVISSVTQNNNNNTTVSTYNSHTHADIAQLGTVTVGVWNATPVQIQFGGTGQTTALAAFTALTPMTTSGDMEYMAGTVPTRLAIGTAGTFLATDGTTPQWVGINLANGVGAGTNPTVGCVTGILPTRNGGSGIAGKTISAGTYTGTNATIAIAHGLGTTPKVIHIFGTADTWPAIWISGMNILQASGNSAVKPTFSADGTNFTITDSGSHYYTQTGTIYDWVAIGQ
jgi:hypothetical protein